MLCQNCGENEANVRYTQVVNGVKKEMALCEKCAHELGIGNMNFSMPISFSSFLGDFFDEEKDNFLPSLMKEEKTICDKCGMTYEDFINTGKFGCENCYETFSNKINPILKNIHGADTHIGRGISLPKGKIGFEKNEELKINSKHDIEKTIEGDKDKQLQKLKKDLKQAIQEERYEDAAKIRDEIKKLVGGNIC